MPGFFDKLYEKYLEQQQVGQQLGSIADNLDIPTQAEIDSLKQTNPLSAMFPDNALFDNSDFHSVLSQLPPDQAITNPHKVALGNTLGNLFRLSNYQEKPDYLGSLFADGGKARHRVNSDQQIVEAQTEGKGKNKEQIVTPDGGIVDVKSTKVHKQMKPEEVTDLIPAGAYIGSIRDKYVVTKKEGEKVSFGYPVTTYSENKVDAPPKENLLSDIMTKNKMNSAELFRRIKTLFPVSDREDDVFTDKTNEDNKQARLPYINAVIDVIESKKPENKTNHFGYGGMTKPQHYPDPMIVAAGVNLLGSVLGFWNNNNQADKAEALFNSNQQLIDKTAQENAGNIEQSTLIGLASTAALSDDFALADLSKPKAEAIEGFDDAIYNVKNSARTQQSRAEGAFNNLSSNLFSNTSSFSKGLEAAMQLYPNLLRGTSDINANANNAISGLNIQKGQTASAFSEKDAMQRQQKANYQTQFNNSKISQFGDLGINRGNQLNAINNNKVNATLVNSGANVAAQQHFASNTSQLTNNLLAGIGMGINALGQPNNNVTNTNPSTATSATSYNPLFNPFWNIAIGSR